MEAYHDNYAEMGRGSELQNGYDSYGRPRAQYGTNGGPQQPLQNPSTPHMHHASSSTSMTTSTLTGGSDHGPSSTPLPSNMSTMTRRMSTSSHMRQEKEDVPMGFDEGVLRALCDMDCALPLLGDRIKQSVSSCKQVATYFRQRADLEDKYGRSLHDLSRTTLDQYGKADCKPGSFLNAYKDSMRIQEQLGQNRMRFAQRLTEMSEELFALAREGEKQRKIHKDNGARYQGILQESEGVMDKAKARFDSTAEELERILVAKEGESLRDAQMRNANAAGLAAGNGSLAAGNNKRGIGKSMAKGLFKGKNPAQMQRHEDDVRARMASASEAFRTAVLESQALRQEYFNFQLPKIVRLLKDCADELDMGMQYHLTRYAFMYETTTVSEGTMLHPNMPEEAPGLKAIFEGIDNRSDFKTFMQGYPVARNTPKGPRRDGPYDEGYLPPLPPHVQAQQNALAAQGGSPQPPPPLPLASNTAPIMAPGPAATDVYQPPAAPVYPTGPIPAATGATFGVDLGEQLTRDAAEVPKVVKKCAETIEAYGLDSMGIYRLSGTTSKVQALKAALDKDIDSVDLMDEQWSSDINVVSGALKLWFRELPEPLLTYGLYHGFVDAARYDNDRLRHIRLHEQVNELPDPNYATLKYFMGHLDKIRRREGVNQMSASNLSIVFGPTLLGAPPEEGGLNLEHMNYQCKAIETILEKYQEIFVEEEDGQVDPAQAQGLPQGQS